MTTNKYGFINAREIFECPEFVGRKETANKYLKYCNERNKKDDWTLNTVFDKVMEETSRGGANDI